MGKSTPLHENFLQSPLLFLVTRWFYSFCFAFPSCGFFKKQHQFNQETILFSSHPVALPTQLTDGIPHHYVLFKTSLLLTPRKAQLLPQIGVEKALQPCLSSYPSLVDMLSLCCVCSCLWLRKVLVYRIRSMPYSFPVVKCVEIKGLCLNLINEQTEDRRSKQLYLGPLQKALKLKHYPCHSSCFYQKQRQVRTSLNSCFWLQSVLRINKTTQNRMGWC